jgi:hypothetical protein
VIGTGRFVEETSKTLAQGCNLLIIPAHPVRNEQLFPEQLPEEIALLP